MVFVKFAAVQPCGKYCRQMRYALLYRHYLIVFILYGLFQCLICDLCIQLYNCSSFFVADDCFLYLWQCLQCLLYGCLAVSTHHSFDFHCFFHSMILLFL